MRPEKSAFDGNGNVRALVKADAANPSLSGIVERYAYDGFGKEIAGTTPSATSVNSVRFSTKQLDAETSMNYYGYRYYASGDGRWINRDPIEEIGGASLYEFALNDSIFNYDVNGLSALPPWGSPQITIGRPAIPWWAKRFGPIVVLIDKWYDCVNNGIQAYRDANVPCVKTEFAAGYAQKSCVESSKNAVSDCASAVSASAAAYTGNPLAASLIGELLPALIKKGLDQLDDSTFFWCKKPPVDPCCKSGK